MPWYRDLLDTETLIFLIPVVAIVVGGIVAIVKSLAKHRYDELKILGDGTLTKKLKVSANRFSASAREKIEQAGGEAVVLVAKTLVSQKQKQSKEGKT